MQPIEPGDSESTISQKLLALASACNVWLGRNNIGAFKDKDNRWVRFGHDNTSPKRHKKIRSIDYLGITPVVITQEMVGKTLGVFTAVEFKDSSFEGQPRDERERAQLTYINFVKANYGFAGFANSEDSLIKIISGRS